jgi:hypothetical protein
MPLLSCMHIAIGSPRLPVLNRSGTHRSCVNTFSFDFRQLLQQLRDGLDASCQRLVETVEALPWTFRAPVDRSTPVVPNASPSVDKNQYPEQALVTFIGRTLASLKRMREWMYWTKP